MRITLAILPVLLIALSGCSSEYMARANARMAEAKRLEAIGLSNMPGHPVSTLVDMYGKPDSEVPLETGEVGYTWTETYYESIPDPDDYLPEEQRKLKRAQEKQDRKDNTFGDSLAAFIFESDEPTSITRFCKLGVMARNGIVVSADVRDADSPAACRDFYSKWRVYQVEHPELFTPQAASMTAPLAPATAMPVNYTGPATTPIPTYSPVRSTFPSPYPARNAR